MPDFIVQTRIIPKKTIGKIIQRDRLSKLIVENIDKNIVLICCPAGYGKTTLVQDYIAKYNKKAAWYQATDDVTNFYSFTSYIVHSLKVLNKDFGKNTIEVADSLKASMQLAKDSETIISTVIGTFINDFVTCFKEETLLVIDDLHLIQNSEWLILTFNKLIENFPDNLHIIITTREQPKFELTKLRAKRRMLELGADELNFTNEEIAKVLDEIYSIKCTPKEIEVISNNIKGWITGIHLMVQAYGNNLIKLKPQGVMLPENIFNFFANDIFFKLDVDIQNFLLNTALLENFTPELCDWLLQRSDGKKIIEELINKNIFIESSRTEKDTDRNTLLTTYNYQSIFKQYLLSKLYELKTENEIQQIFLRISEYFKKNDDIISIISYDILGKNFDSAIELIIKEYDRLYKERKLEILWNWISKIPEELVYKYNRLLFIKGVLQRSYMGEHEIAHQYFNDTLKHPETVRDTQLIIDCHIQNAELAFSFENLDKASQDLIKLINMEMSLETRVRVIYSIAKAYYKMSYEKYNEAIKLLNEALELCKDQDLKLLQSDIFDLLGLIYQLKGEFIKSLFYYEIVVKSQANVYRKFRTFLNIATLFSWLGDFKKARSSLNEALNIKRRYPSPLFDRYFLLETSFNDFACGDYENSIIRINQMREMGNFSNFNYFMFIFHLHSGECYYYLNELNKSKQYYEQALKYIDEKDIYQKIQYNIAKAILLKKYRVEPSIEEYLLKAFQYYKENIILYDRVQIEFHLADYYFKNGLTMSSISYLESTLKIASEKQFLSYFERSFIDHRYLFDFAIANNIEKDFIATIFAAVTDRVNYDWVSPECRKRLEKDSENLYDINLKTFGGAEISVRGNSITEDKWIRKKSKQLLIYLLINPGMKFSKEKIIDMFFQDVSIDSAENLFHQVITNIRNATVIEYSFQVIPSKEKQEIIQDHKTTKKSGSKNNKIQTNISPEFIIYEDKILRLNPNYNYKVDALVFNKLFNLFKSAGSDEKAKIKVIEEITNLYKGEFLAGYYETWCEELRENYISKMIDLLENAITIFKQKEDHYKIIEYCEKLLQLDKLHEEAYLNIIEVYAKTSNFSMARKKFSVMLKHYQNEYGEKPSKNTLDKIQTILIK